MFVDACAYILMFILLTAYSTAGQLKLFVQRSNSRRMRHSALLLYGPPWAHHLGGYQDRLLGGPLGLLGLCHTAPDSVRRKDYDGQVLG
jgi:hypothetical protein